MDRFKEAEQRNHLKEEELNHLQEEELNHLQEEELKHLQEEEIDQLKEAQIDHHKEAQIDHHKEAQINQLQEEEASPYLEEGVEEEAGVNQEEVNPSGGLQLQHPGNPGLPEDHPVGEEVKAEDRRQANKNTKSKVSHRRQGNMSSLLLVKLKSLILRNDVLSDAFPQYFFLLRGWDPPCSSFGIWEGPGGYE